MDPDDIAVLLFTSGTTGAPKAAILRQKHLVSYILGAVEFAPPPTTKPRWCACRPITSPASPRS